MIYSAESISNLAKRIAMYAIGQVDVLASAVVDGSEFAAEVTGAAAAVLPHLVEKAIVVNCCLPGDVSLQVATQFLREYEALMRITANAGGFSSPIKKALFNAAFHTMFLREYESLKPKMNELWEIGRSEQADPIDYIAYGLLGRCQSSSGLKLDHDENIATCNKAVHALFHAVDELVKRA